MSEPLLIRKNTSDIDQDHKEGHFGQGVYLKSMIYGGLDGCINSLVLILSAIASETKASQIMALSLAAIVGQGIGMGLGDYISAKAQLKYIKCEKKRELYQVQHLLTNQKKQIIDIYREKGYNLEDANRLSQLYATNSQAFVNIMMLQELGLVVGNEEEAKKCGLVTFLSFIILGAIIALPYVFSWGILGLDSQQTTPVIAIGAIELFSLGFAKAAIIGLNKWKAGFQTLILGSAITAIGFVIGLFFKL